MKKLLNDPLIGDIWVSKRKGQKTLRLSFNSKGQLNLSMPYLTPQAFAMIFARKKQSWIEEQRTKYNPISSKLNKHEKLAIRDKLYQALQSASKKTGITYETFAASSMRLKWGYCTSAGLIKLSYHADILPDDLLEYLCIHELCHIRHQNHSASFWALVESHCPDYKQKRKMLKTYHPSLL
jgi:predicted metal-dependent hydrolase